MFYSQFGEDRVLAGIFARPHGVCVEVGANNGVDGSTTLHFEERGWDCVLVEPIPELCEALRQRRRAKVFECAASEDSGSAVLQVAVGAELSHAVSALGASAGHIHKRHGFRTRPLTVQTRKLDDILEEAGVKPGIDFISIDVEGHELEMLKGFSPDRWKPKILIIEDNTALGDAGVIGWLRERGYVRFLRTGVNDWYAHESNAALASPARRLGYWPSMLKARAFMVLERGVAPIAPFLKRIPGMVWFRSVLLRQASPLPRAD